MTETQSSPPAFLTERLTATAMACLRTCPLQYWHRYEQRLIKGEERRALKLGTAYHLGQHLHHMGWSDEDAINYAAGCYSEAEQLDFHTVRSILAGHFWRYRDDGFTMIAPEMVFEIQLVNPESGAPSRTFHLAGKIDVIVQLPDGRHAVQEYKTASDDLGPDSQYWLRLRKDPQISLYYLAARALGYEVQTIIYDVARKPSIAPRQIPLLDEAGLKVVLDAAGDRVLTKQGKPRQTGDSELGYVLQTREETPEEFGKRFLDDIAERPEFYLARREVPRLEDDLRLFQADVWQQAKYLMWCRRSGHWFASPSRFTCPWCDYADLCLQSIQVADGQVPVGYTRVADPHPELSIDPRIAQMKSE